MERPAREIEDFDKLAEVYWLPVFRFLLSSLRDRDAAETLTQECFLRAYRGRQHFRGDSSAKTWLMQIAVNLVRDFTRSRRLQFWRKALYTGTDAHVLRAGVAARETSPEQQTLANEQINAVWQATLELSPRQRTVFLLRFVEDMDLLEIAEVTGMREGTVKAHLFRALNKVRECMRRLG
jgi:RNA polymerase sigma-70 factor (ECF subfamily)